MENKYYTPEIDEFKVGFECEIKNSSDPIYYDWEHYKIISVDDAEISGSLMDWSFYDSRNAINDGMVRVKYLDRENIESLGFSCKIGSMYNRSDLVFTNKSCHITMQSNSGKIIIERNQDHLFYEHPEILFNGFIKNKSELKDILKMIGVK